MVGISVGERRTLRPEALDVLIRLLRGDGFTVVGPVVRDGAIVHDELRSSAQLPAGWGDEQAPGRYRLVPRDDGALFGWSVGPQSWKRLLHEPRRTLFTARRTGRRLEVIEPEPAPPRRLALLGARACELAAIEVQDRTLRDGPFADAHYAARREGLLVIAVECGAPSGVCFCASMGTGPDVKRGADLTLTELAGEDAPEGHALVARADSAAGAALLARLASAPCDEAHSTAAHAVVQRAAGRMGRTLDTTGVRELLQANHDHARWDDVAARCLACGNCTMACPTCFCTATEDASNLDGSETERSRRWASCFEHDFSHVHGGPVRESVKGRYRQWLTHKLSTWFDQFGTSGCVGCGRCIAWCPVGIDLTEEVAAIRATPAASASEASSCTDRGAYWPAAGDRA